VDTLFYFVLNSAVISIIVVRNVLIRVMGHGWHYELLPGHFTQLV